MTLAELRAEVYARGFDYEGDTDRIDRWINQAYQELCEETAWPFLEASTSGTAPVTITDVRTVQSVSNTTTGRTLDGLARRDVVDVDPEVDDAGSPTHFYLDAQVLRVFPLNTTDTISVRYLKIPTALASDSDTPIVPTRYQDLIVDGAVIRAYKDDDEMEAAGILRQVWAEGVQRMRKGQLDRDYSGVGHITITDLSGWS